MAEGKGFSDEEKDLLKAKGMPWRLWKVIYRTPSGMIVKNAVNGEVRLIEKD